jgi:hypothetical protein
MVFDFDDAPVVDLDDHLRAQFGLGERVESMPLFTTMVGEVVLTVIRVTHDGRTRHQVYAVTEGTWALVAIFGLYMDAMGEVLRWRRYLDGGGTVAAWVLAHLDGVTPETQLCANGTGS